MKGIWVAVVLLMSVCADMLKVAALPSGPPAEAEAVSGKSQNGEKEPTSHKLEKRKTKNEKRDITTDLEALGMSNITDAKYETAHSELMGLPSIKGLLDKADGDLKQIVAATVAEKNVQAWFLTAFASNDITKLDYAGLTGNINKFLNVQTTMITLMKKHANNPILNTVSQQVDIVKATFMKSEKAMMEVMEKFDILLFPEDTIFVQRLVVFLQNFQDPAKKLKQYFEAEDHSARSKVGITQDDYTKTLNSYFSMLNLFTGWARRADQPKLCDYLPRGNRTTIIQVSLVLYNTMMMCARNTLLIGTIRDVEGLRDIQNNLEKFLKDVRIEIKRCVRGGKKKAKKASAKATVTEAETEAIDLTELFTSEQIQVLDELEDEYKQKYVKLAKAVKNVDVVIGNCDGSSRCDMTDGPLLNIYREKLIECADNGQTTDSSGQSCKDALQESEKATNAARIGSALDAGSTITSWITDTLAGVEKGKILGQTMRIANHLAPFLGALGPFVAIIGTFSDSPEVQAIKEVLETVNKGFKRVGKKLDILFSAVQDITIVIQQEFFEQAVNAEKDKLNILKSHINTLFESSEDKNSVQYNYEKGRLISTERWMLDADAAIIKIYNMFTGNDDTDPWCNTLRGLTGEDREEIMRQSMKYFKIWMEGVQSYIFVETLKGTEEAIINSTIAQKARWAEEIYNSIVECEEKVHWRNHWKEDVQRAAMSATPEASADAIATTIYDTLYRKYPGRDWLVVVYTTTAHEETVGGGLIRDQWCTGKDMYGDRDVPDLEEALKDYEQMYDVPWTGRGKYVITVKSVDNERVQPPTDMPSLMGIHTGVWNTYTWPSCCWTNGKDITRYYYDAASSSAVLESFPSAVTRDAFGHIFKDRGVVRASDFAIKAKPTRHQVYSNSDGSFRVRPEPGVSFSVPGPQIRAWYFA